MARYSFRLFLILCLATAHCFPHAELSNSNKRKEGKQISEEEEVNLKEKQPRRPQPFQFLKYLQSSTDKADSAEKDLQDDTSSSKKGNFDEKTLAEDSKQEKKDTSKEEESSLIEYDLSEAKEDSTITAKPFDLTTTVIKLVSINVSDEDPLDSFDEEEILNSKKVMVTVPAPANIIKKYNFSHFTLLMDQNYKKEENQFDMPAKENKTNNSQEKINDIDKITFEIKEENKESSDPISNSELVIKDPEINTGQVITNNPSIINSSENKNIISDTLYNENKITAYETELKNDHTTAPEFPAQETKYSYGHEFTNLSHEDSSRFYENSNNDNYLDSNEIRHTYDSDSGEFNSKMYDRQYSKDKESEKTYTKTTDSTEHENYKKSSNRKTWPRKKHYCRRCKVDSHKKKYGNEFGTKTHSKNYHFDNKYRRYKQKDYRRHKYSNGHWCCKNRFSRNRYFDHKKHYDESYYPKRHGYHNDRKWKEYNHDEQNYIGNDFNNKKRYRSYE